jgi:hypothetical protein
VSFGCFLGWQHFQSDVSTNISGCKPVAQLRKKFEDNSLLPARLLLGGAFLLFFSGLTRRASAQLSTIEHVAKPGFWATQISNSPADFAGSAACGKCHLQISASQRSVPMALAVPRAGESDLKCSGRTCI